MRAIARLAAALLIVPTATAQSQTIRNSTPPNPLNPVAFLPDPAGGPTVGVTWAPLVDNSPGLFPPPTAPVWFVAICNGPAAPEIVFQGSTILCSIAPPNPLAVVGPAPAPASATPFPVPIPAQSPLVGAAFSTQAFMIDAAPGFRPANAIDVVVGADEPGGLYSVSSRDNLLRRLDPATGATLSSVSIDVPGLTITANGLARHPLTGELYAIVDAVPAGPAPPPGKGKKRGHPGGSGTPGPPAGRRLVTVNPVNGKPELKGATGELFAAIAFDATGRLWGVTGDGSFTPESLFRIDADTGASTFIATLGNGGDGELFGFNPQDGLLYHGSGNAALGGGTNAFETIDPDDPTAPPVPVPLGAPLATGDETNALSALDSSTGEFWWATGCCATPELYRVTPGGVATLVGPLDHSAKGLVVLD